jgi:hypothetical protein
MLTDRVEAGSTWEVRAATRRLRGLGGMVSLCVWGGGDTESCEAM